MVVSSFTTAVVLVGQFVTSRVPSAVVGTFSLKTAVAKGASTLHLQDHSVSAHGVTPGKLVVINPGRENEETAVVAGLDPFSLEAPLEYGHEVNEPIIALRATKPGLTLARVPYKPESCSASKVWESPPVKAVEDGAAALFDDLSPEEIKAATLTFTKATGAATGPDKAKSGQAFIIGTGAVELLYPSKQDSIAFLDSKGPRPPRYARIICARPREGDVMEYRIGPITGTRYSPHVESKVEKLLKDGAVPYSKRPPDLGDVSLNPLTIATLKKMQGLLEDTFGHVWKMFDSFNPAEGIALCWPVFPDLKSDLGSRVTMAKFFWQNTKNLEQINSAMWLHPMPLVFRFNQTGIDPSNWYAFGFYFCGQGPFSSAEELQSAHEGKKLKPCPWERPDTETNSLPGDWDVAGPAEGVKNPRTSKRGPRLVYPDGPRWEVSSVPGGLGRQVEWMGWSFFVSMRP